MNRKVMLILIFTLTILFAASSAFSQDGRWVPYDLSSIGSTQLGSGARGDGIVCFAPENSEYFLIFDVQEGEWLTIEFNEEQDFDFFDTEDNVVFGFTDNLILGYSALTRTWDTVYYSGTVLADGVIAESYGMKGNLAFFVTENTFYVFDAEIGEWASYPFSLPASYSSGRFRIGNNYIAMQLGKSDPVHAAPKNVVYSAITKDFNELEDGCQVPSPPMKDGFADYWDLTGYGDTFRIVGYSALTNTFNAFTYDASEEATVSSWHSWNEETRTVFACGFYTVISYVSVTIKYYAYDTNLGTWNENIYVHDLNVEYPNRYIHIGGRGAMDNSNFDDGSYHWFFYNGVDGSFADDECNLVYKSTTSGWNCGGSVFCAFDTLRAYGYDFIAKEANEITLDYDKTTSFKFGENYASLTRWSPDVDMMRIYFYNSDNNRWSSVEVPDDHSGSLKTTFYGYIRVAGDENIVVYYSSYNDNIVTLDLDDGISCYVYICDRLACARSDGGSVLIDDMRQTTQAFDFNISSSGLGTNSGLFYNDAGDVMYGYSSLSGEVTQHTFTETPYFCNDTGYIGIMTVYYGVSGYNKIYTYNSFADSFIELIPSGSHGSILVGKRTALIARNGSPDMLYAFDPERTTTDIAEDDGTTGVLPAEFSLEQNYPNPFNPSTVIKYSVPYRSEVSIDIFNILGQKVRALKDNETHAAGTYSATWDGTGDDGHAVSSGMYFYRLKAGEKVLAKKMMMVK